MLQNSNNMLFVILCAVDYQIWMLGFSIFDYFNSFIFISRCWKYSILHITISTILLTLLPLPMRKRPHPHKNLSRERHLLDGWWSNRALLPKPILFSLVGTNRCHCHLARTGSEWNLEVHILRPSFRMLRIYVDLMNQQHFLNT